MNSNFDIAHAASTWTQTSDKDFDNGTSNNLTIIGGGEAAELQIDLSEIKHWTDKTPIPRPPSGYPTDRWMHAMAPVWGTDKAVMFGGAWPINNETWVYDSSNSTWRKLTPVGPSSPSARYCHSMVSIPGTDKILLFGGIWYNDTWIYSLNNNTWEEKTPLVFTSKNNPSERYSSAMAAIPKFKKILLFGGYYDFAPNYLNDTWEFDVITNTWRAIDITGNNPAGRFGHAMASVNSGDKVILFGGEKYASNLRDTWTYDANQKIWIPKSPPDPKPKAVMGAAMTSIHGTDEILLYGGVSHYPPYYSNETWIYDPDNGTEGMWVMKYNITDPPDRYGFGMANIYQTDYIVLFGGSLDMDDTWVYKHKLNPKNGTYVSTPFDTGSNSSFNTLSWDSVIPRNTYIRLQLKTADNQSNLDSRAFVGPDGDPGSFYTLSPIDIWSGHNGDRWIQYKAYLNITVVKDSPSLKDVTITYNCLPKTTIVSPSDEAILTNNKPTFKWTFEDVDSDKQEAFQIVIDDSMDFNSIDFDSGEQNTKYEYWEFPAGTNYTALPDGIWYWKVRTKDFDGAWTEYTKTQSLMVDTKLPNSTTNIPANNGYYKNLDKISGVAADGEIGSGINKIEISIKRLSDNYYWSNTSWVKFPVWLTASGGTEWLVDSSTVTWTSGARYIIQSRATDNASNVEPVSEGNIFTIDMDCPVSKIDSPKNSVWLNKLESITGTSYDISGSGIVKVEISLKCTQDANLWDGDAKVNNYWDGSEWRSKETWLNVMGTDKWVYNSSMIPYSTGNEYLISCRGIDTAGNLEVPADGNSFMVDSIQPANLSLYINNGDKYTRSNKVKLSLQAEDIGSGVSQMAFSTDNSEWSDWVPFSTESNFTIQANDGEKPIYFRVKDYAGNIAESVQGTIYLDTTAPKDLSIKINANAKYTNSKNVKFTLHGVDTGSGIKDMTYSEDGINWQSWELYRTTRRFMIFGDDGEKIIYFKLRDKVGNVAEPVSDTIIVDTTPPHSLMVVINNGVLETNSTLVTLKFNAIDDSSRVAEMSFSSDDIVWSPWENYTILKKYTLPPGEGEKTIYFKVKDIAGNEAEPISASITLISQTQDKENNDTSFTISSIEFWIILLVIITVILLVVNIVLMLKRRRLPEREGPSAALTVKPGQRFAPMEPFAQVPAAIKPEQLPGTVAVSASQQTSVATPTLAKSTQGIVTSSLDTVPDLPVLPPAIIHEEKLETATPTLEPTVASSSPSPSTQPTLVEPVIPEAGVQTQVQSQTPTQSSTFETPSQPHAPQSQQTQQQTPAVTQPKVSSEQQQFKQKAQNENN